MAGEVNLLLGKIVVDSPTNRTSDGAEFCKKVPLPVAFEIPRVKILQERLLTIVVFPSVESDANEIKRPPALIFVGHQLSARVIKPLPSSHKDPESAPMGRNQKQSAVKIPNT